MREDEWISVKDEVPETECVAFGYQGNILIGYVTEKPKGVFTCENDHEVLTHVTHWQPLPNPPKQ